MPYWPSTHAQTGMISPESSTTARAIRAAAAEGRSRGSPLPLSGLLGLPPSRAEVSAGGSLSYSRSAASWHWCRDGRLAKGAVAGGAELGEFVVDVDGDGADQPDGFGLRRGQVRQQGVVDQPALGA